MNVVLREMYTEEFTVRRAELVRDTAASLAAYRGLSVRETELLAEQSTADLLPDGPQSPRQLLRTALDGDRVVGWVWISLPGTYASGVAWISDVAVDPEFHSRGYGRAIMTAAEKDLAERGLDRVGLSVDGGNAVARALYEKLGYEVIRQQWARALGDIPGTPESPVTLAADGTATVDGRPVGRVCWTDRHRDRPGTGWISEFDADPADHGAQILAAVERDLVRRGARSIGTEIGGEDHGMRRLLQRSGFELMAQQMEKPL
jgi:mycothiol synthase